MNITGQKLRRIIKEELDRVNLSEYVEASDVSNLKEPVPADPDSLANNIKIASRILEELVGGELAELAGVTEKLSDSAQILRDVLDELSVENPNQLGMHDPSETGDIPFLDGERPGTEFTP